MNSGIDRLHKQFSLQNEAITELDERVTSLFNRRIRRQNKGEDYINGLRKYREQEEERDKEKEELDELRELRFKNMKNSMVADRKRKQSMKKPKKIKIEKILNQGEEIRKMREIEDK